MREQHQLHETPLPACFPDAAAGYVRGWQLHLEMHAWQLTAQAYTTHHIWGLLLVSSDHMTTSLGFLADTCRPASSPKNA